MGTMDKRFEHNQVEKRIYKMWERGGYFRPKIDPKKKPFTVILPPPNASGKMHTGNVLMIAIEDLLVRWHRMRGDPTLWVPGSDHAGFETQITFERKLAKNGKSRFDYDRATLYQMIWDFVRKNKGEIDGQIRAMGASVDWERYTFTLDRRVVKTVYETFKKMYKEGLVYRDNYMVNYCPECGTTFADLEVKHQEREDPLYFVRYPLFDRSKNEPEHLVVATVRPETIMIDTHLAVNPEDKKNKKWVGRKVNNPILGHLMEIIGDGFVDPKFGTGIVKLTPGHDKNDWEVARKYDLPVKNMLTLKGKVTDQLSEVKDFAGLSVREARKKVVKKLNDNKLMERVNEKYSHSVAVCYKAGHDIEPMVLPNWFVRVDDPDKSLKGPAYEVVKSGEVKIYPKWREKTYLRWMEEMRDWPISRQVVWGIRIPVWYEYTGANNLHVLWINKKGVQNQGNIRQFVDEGISLSEIRAGLQRVYAMTGISGPKFKIQEESPGDDWFMETDTFDTWFSSAHWPLVTLGYPDSEDFSYFYPTSVLETGWEIVRLWVSRMIMFGIYLADKPPFSDVYLHGLVKALDGKKMSKSLGNVIDPSEYIEEYGVDALRMGLIAGTANGKDFRFPHDKVLAYRNFANKLWNMARFMNIMLEKHEEKVPIYSNKLREKLSKDDEKILKRLDETIESVDGSLEDFRFSMAGETIYHFMWHEVADEYIEIVKERKDKEIALAVLRHVMINGLKLLHPFMPFVTEAIWEHIPRKYNDPLIVSKWPSV